MPAELTLDFGWLLRAILALTRMGGLFAFVPAPGWKQSPIAARFLLSLSITVVLYPAWSTMPVAEVTPGLFLVWMLAEAVIGVGVGLAIAFLSESFAIAAQIFGLQAGYSYASTIDPSSEADASILPVLTQLAAGLLFFAAGLDRELIRALARSFDRLPPGALLFSLSAGEQMIRLGGSMLSLGFRLALPIVAMLVLIDIATALIGKVQAQLQLLALTFPIKMLLSLALLAALAGALPRIYEKAAGQAFEMINGLFTAGTR